MPSRIACQMYTLRNFTKTPADIARTMKRLREIGYQAVQLSALGPIESKELAKILEGEDFAVCATHISQERMNNETEKVIEDHKLWNCSYTAVGGWNPKEKGSTQAWIDFARSYNETARKFAGSGIAIGYHNHSHELVKFDGKPALQIFYEHADQSVWMEIDTYWIVQGGGDPIQWIDKVAGRIPCVHLKDMLVRHDRTQYMAEVGEGNLNWPGIHQACKRAGVKWYIVEQDECYRDPFESVKISLENLRSMGIT